jgi:hypothetical protein
MGGYGNVAGWRERSKGGRLAAASPWGEEKLGQKTFENLNSFLDDIENAKNDANILKTYFFGFSLFFAIFGFSENFIKKVGQKLGSNKINGS